MHRSVGIESAMRGVRTTFLFHGERAEPIAYPDQAMITFL